MSTNYYDEVPDHYVRLHYKCTTEGCECDGEETVLDPMEVSQIWNPVCSQGTDMCYQFVSVKREEK